MPRKKTVQDNITVKKNTKKNIIDTMIKSSDDNNDIIIQLPLNQSKINNIINNNDTKDEKMFFLSFLFFGLFLVVFGVAML